MFKVKRAISSESKEKYDFEHIKLGDFDCKITFFFNMICNTYELHIGARNIIPRSSMPLTG